MKFGIALFFLTTTLFSFSQETSKQDFNIEKWRLLLNQTVKDIDGNIYHTQKLGEQIWMIENLKVTKFNTGKEIMLSNDSSKWIYNTYPSFCNLIVNVVYHDSLCSAYRTVETKTNEILYNFYVIEDQDNVCPQGWRIPTVDDWQELQSYVDKVNWDFYDKAGGYVESDFTGLSFSDQAYGYRSGTTGEFLSFDEFGFWFAEECFFHGTAWSKFLKEFEFGVDEIHLEEFANCNKQNGRSIKCIKE